MKQTYEHWEGRGQDIDLDLDCICGVSFRMFVPYCVYKCPGCGKLYEAKVVVESLEESDKEDNYVLVGKENTNG
jgi:hypothetical protein